MPLAEIKRVSERHNQPRCRNFGALQRWAEDPSNALPFEYLSGHQQVTPQKFCSAQP